VTADLFTAGHVLLISGALYASLRRSMALVMLVITLWTALIITTALTV
jgi:hypothetical protein